MGGCFGSLGAEPPEAIGGTGVNPPAAGGWGSGGKAYRRRSYGGLGAEPPNARKFCIFCKNNLILGQF